MAIMKMSSGGRRNSSYEREPYWKSTHRQQRPARSHEEYDGTRSSGCLPLFNPLIHLLDGWTTGGGFQTNDGGGRRRKNGFDYVDTWGDEVQPWHLLQQQQQELLQKGKITKGTRTHETTHNDLESTTSTITFADGDDEQDYGYKDDDASMKEESRQSSVNGSINARDGEGRRTDVASVEHSPLRSTRTTSLDILDLTGGMFDDVAAAKAWVALSASSLDGQQD